MMRRVALTFERSARSYKHHKRLMSSEAKRFEGKVAVVTASTDGIGYAIAERLGMDGAKVMVSSRKPKNVTNTVAQLQSKGIICEGIPCHVGSGDDRQALIDATLKSFGVVPHMIERGGGSIVYVSSIAGYVPINMIGAYSVSKTALLGLTKAVAAAVSDDNIRVNGVAPGIIRTKFSSAMWSDEDVGEETLNHVPLGRFGESKDIAGVTAFLCSDDSAYITGETIVAAGGMNSHL